MFTVDVFEEMSRDDRWLGHGYLGARRNALDTSDSESHLDPAIVAEADRIAVERANTRDMSYDAFFEWANSKVGRWYGDTMFGGGSRADMEKVLPGVSLYFD